MLMRVTDVTARVLAACAGLLFAAPALAQTPGYPDRPVKIIVPFAAAGPTDVVARLIALKLSEKFGQQFYIHGRGWRQSRYGRRRPGAGRRLHDPVRVVELHRQSEPLRQAS